MILPAHGLESIIAIGLSSAVIDGIAHVKAGIALKDREGAPCSSGAGANVLLNADKSLTRQARGMCT